MVKKHNILKQGAETTYPGYGRGKGYVQNLSTYRANCTIKSSDAGRLDSGRLVLGEGNLAFDIERHVNWGKGYNLLPFKYSMMIDGYYPISRWSFWGRESKPTREDFSETASQLEGFVLDEEPHRSRVQALSYTNTGKNVFINWGKTGRICIGVIQNEPLPDLYVVTNEIVPYAVSLFNRLSPTLQLTDFVVKMSIEAALLSDKLIPKCRIEGR